MHLKSQLFFKLQGWVNELKRKDMHNTKFKYLFSINYLLMPEDEVVSIPKQEIDRMNVVIESLELDYEALKSDFSGYKKRVRIEAEKNEKKVLNEMGKKILVVLDALDHDTYLDSRTYGNDSCELIQAIKNDFRNNLVTTYSQLIQAVDLTPIGPSSGDKFDGFYHSAAQTVENKNVPDKTIINLIKKGYSLNDEVLRPAEVVISSSSVLYEAKDTQKKRILKRILRNVSNTLESIIFKERFEELTKKEDKLRDDEGLLLARARGMEALEDKIIRDIELHKKREEELFLGFEELKIEREILKKEKIELLDKTKKVEELLLKYRVYEISGIGR